jgi:hypothetical protein
MSDQRLVPRQRAYLYAQATFPGSKATTKCIIENLAEHGAKIRFQTDYKGPDEFALRIPELDETLAVRLVWQRSDGAGVAFLTPLSREFIVSCDPSVRAFEREMDALGIRAPAASDVEQDITV